MFYTVIVIRPTSHADIRCADESIIHGGECIFDVACAVAQATGPRRAVHGEVHGGEGEGGCSDESVPLIAASLARAAISYVHLAAIIQIN